LYCRYLDCHIHYLNPSQPCGGAFGNYLKNNLGIRKLPYQISILELVAENLMPPSAFVRLPTTYFSQWDNYPHLGRESSIELSDELKLAGLFNLYIEHSKLTTINDLGHPYDLELKNSFLDRFSISPVADLEIIDHPNGRQFRPYEIYLPYWTAFMLLEVLEECRFIDKYLPSDQGIRIFKEKAASIQQRWNKGFTESFNRISHYRTVVTQLGLAEDIPDMTYGEQASYILKLADAKISDLETDMQRLLTLFNLWSDKYKKGGLPQFGKAIEILKRDIYYLFEWLCSTGADKHDLFTRWSYDDRQPRAWADLREVLDFEEIRFRQCFLRYTEYYCKSTPDRLTQIDFNSFYTRAEELNGFYPWIRAFYNLHEAINHQGTIALAQPRILDNLLIYTIRTEILLRAMYQHIAGKTELDSLREMLVDYKQYISDTNCHTILDAVKSEWSLTELRSRPQDIFANIKKKNIGKKWSKEQKHLFQSMMYFIASRNYFAHHHYNDKEFDSHVNELCGEILKSCLHTVLYTDSYLS